MITKEERIELWKEYSGGQRFADEKLGEDSRAEIFELANRIRHMRSKGLFKTTILTDYEIASEIRHHALWLLTQRRQCESGPLPAMATAYSRIR